MEKQRYWWYTRVEKENGELMEFVYPCDSAGNHNVALNQIMSKDELDKYCPMEFEFVRYEKGISFLEAVPIMQFLECPDLDFYIYPHETRGQYKRILDGSIFTDISGLYNVEKVTNAKSVLICPIDTKYIGMINNELRDKGIEPITFFE